MLLEEERRQLVAHAQRLRADGLVVGTAGNLSARAGDLVAATPSSLAYEALTPELVCVHRMDATVVEAALPVTVELPMHLAAYDATGAAAVVHTHATAATAVGLLVDELPAVHYMIEMFGGPVRVTPYVVPGTPELAEAMAEGIAGRSAVLLGSHGTIVVGDSVAEAYERTLLLEWLCDLYLRARAAGSPRILSGEQLEAVAGTIDAYSRSVADLAGR
jgi:L-fuculose-phosphate aldolase